LFSSLFGCENNFPCFLVPPHHIHVCVFIYRMIFVVRKISSIYFIEQHICVIGNNSSTFYWLRSCQSERYIIYDWIIKIYPPHATLFHSTFHIKNFPSHCDFINIFLVIKSQLMFQLIMKERNEIKLMEVSIQLHISLLHRAINFNWFFFISIYFNIHDNISRDIFFSRCEMFRVCEHEREYRSLWKKYYSRKMCMNIKYNSNNLNEQTFSGKCAWITRSFYVTKV
jgi:hypothetical protein